MDHPGLIDTHAHLDPAYFGDELPELIARAAAAGLRQIINVGSGGDVATCERAIEIANTRRGIFAAIGIHPHDVHKLTPSMVEEIEQLAATHSRVVAIGETGLDYHYDHSPRELQRDALRAFLRLARKRRLPVVLHIRDRDGSAHRDAKSILAEERIHEHGGVVHCFTGTRDDALDYIELGLHISFSGIITFKTASELREAAARVPRERTLVETDCPYLAPVPHRGGRNEPAHVVHTAEAVAQAQGTTLAELAQYTTLAARAVFRLDSNDLIS
jgi:TatD DNase family protein